MIQYTLDNIDLSFPFDEKFYIYKSEKNTILYNLETEMENIFLIGLCISFLKEGKNIIYVTNKNNYILNLCFNEILPNCGELFVLPSTITFKKLKTITKKIDIIIFEDLSQCKTGTQLKKIFLEFEFKERNLDTDNLNLLNLKNKILDRIKFLEIPNVIFGNTNKYNSLPNEDFDYVFEIKKCNFTPPNQKKPKILQLGLCIKDIKNRYFDSIMHDKMIFSFDSYEIICESEKCD